MCFSRNHNIHYGQSCLWLFLFFCSLKTEFKKNKKLAHLLNISFPESHFFLSKCESVAGRCRLMRHETLFNLQLISAKFVELHLCLFSLFLLLLCLVFRMTLPVSVLFWLLVSVIFFISRSQWTQSCRYVSVNFCTKIYITFVFVSVHRLFFTWFWF